MSSAYPCPRLVGQFRSALLGSAIVAASALAQPPAAPAQKSAAPTQPLVTRSAVAEMKPGDSKDPVLLPIGNLMVDTGGMIQLPVRATTEPATPGEAVALDAKGQLTGAITTVSSGARTPAVARSVYLVEAGKVVASAKTDASGTFELTAPHAGNFTFMAGQFLANGMPRKLSRIDAGEAELQPVVLQQTVKGVAPRAMTNANLPPQDVVPAVAVGNPIGTAVNGNDKVRFVSGEFREPNGRKQFAGNELFYLEPNGVFRGIVTGVSEEGTRTGLNGANLFLIRRGVIVARTVTGQDGSFDLQGLTPGGYTMIASVVDVISAAPGISAPVGLPVAANITAFANPGVVTTTVAGLPIYSNTAIATLGSAPSTLLPTAASSAAFPTTVAIAPTTVAIAPMTAAVPIAAFGPTAADEFTGGFVNVYRGPPVSLAIQRIALQAPEQTRLLGLNPSKADFRLDGSDELVRVFFQVAAPSPLPVVNLAPAPFEDLRTLVPAAAPGAPGFAPGGLGGGGGAIGGGGFGGLGGLAGLAAAAGVAAASGSRSTGTSTFVASPSRP